MPHKYNVEVDGNKKHVLTVEIDDPNATGDEGEGTESASSTTFSLTDSVTGKILTITIAE